MLLNLMEGDTIATSNLISSIRSLSTDGKRHGTIKTLLKNFILPEPDMAIKENKPDKNTCVYSVPMKPALLMTDRMKSINEAKKAFLNSTITTNTTLTRNELKRKEPTIHYAQLDITTRSEDTRSTGGGLCDKNKLNNTMMNDVNQSVDILPNIKKRLEQNQRKVSFKIKNASSSYKKPPLAAKTLTIPSSKVSHLTEKFNLLNESHNKTPKQSKLAKTFEELQTTRCSASNSSTPSSTLSSSPNIKIVVRQRRGSKKRNSKTRCSSVDSVDKLILTDSSNTQIKIIRSKSEGTKITKSSKKRLKYNDSSEQQSSSDSVDGNLVKVAKVDPPKVKISVETNVVKNVIKKFECEIIAQSKTNNNTTFKSNPTRPISATLVKEKPKVPEKKSSIVLTKNIVLKDGVPKIRTIKPISNESPTSDIKKVLISEVTKRKEPIYDRKKFKTNYIHTDKLPLKVVEIIPEDIESVPVTNISSVQTDISKNITQIKVINKQEKEDEQVCQDVDTEIAPNESFLWRRKSSTQIYSDADKLIPENIYGFVSITVNNNALTCSDDLEEISITENSQNIATEESQNSEATENPNMDFESNLVEAYNKEVLLGFTTKLKKQSVDDNDYEVLEPRNIENVVVIPVRNLDRTSKINCPLPEIPQCNHPAKTETKQNVYKCLLEMRSHPEGDENSFHNYELCETQMEERTRGDGDSDDGYEYCKSPIKPYCLTSSSGIQIAEDYKPYGVNNDKNYVITKSVSGTSTVSYEKIGSDRIYEKIPHRTVVVSKNSDSPRDSSRRSSISDYGSYNDGENIYDTIKHADGTSLSHCYESIPNSPSMVKLRNNMKKQSASAVQKRLSFDTMSNVSQCTLSSEQKTNSLYGQRSVVSYNGQEIAFQVPSSEASVSDRSDRSDDWVDVSDEEKYDEQKIIIVRERSRGRKSPLSWSQKVRHQWLNSPKKTKNKDCDSSDSGHLYESLDPAPPVPPGAHGAHSPHVGHIEEDFDSFDSDTDTDDHEKSRTSSQAPPLPASRLPTPPSGGQYTLTKIASAAQRKMRQIKRNLTKRYSVAMDGKPFTKSPPSPNGIYEVPNPKSKKAPIYANYEREEKQHVYSNIMLNDTKPAAQVAKGAETSTATKANGFQDELKTVIGEKRMSNGELPPPLPEKPVSCQNNNENMKKEGGTLSRKAYFSFKSRFRRATSLAVDINDVPSALKITNSTFYLTDSMDGDSGFSNCSDQGQQSGPSGSAETLSPCSTAPRRDGTRLRAGWAESSPCLALERPSIPPPPPPADGVGPAISSPTSHGASSSTDLSAVNEELKRLLPSLSRKEKSPRARTSWYAECGADIHTPSTSWYAEAGLYQAGNISTSSGASSGSHPASPLPHSLFTHEPLYQFYNAAKVESVCRETSDSDSDAYEPGGRPPAPPDVVPAITPTASPQPPAGVTAAPRPSAMALVAPRGPARTLWCEVPEVVNSAVLSSLAPAQKRLQEAKFELLTSEASYLNSLSVLETHFIAHPAFRVPHILSREDWETLFSTILPVRKCSQLLMNELEKCWQENILLQGICDIVRHHAEQHFQVYVKYCENQTLMVKALQRLRDKPVFAAALTRLESHPACQSLSLHSFLMLPMQRVTRLPLLLDAVLKNLSSEDDEYDACMHALATLNDYVSQCNEGARNTERIEEMYRLSKIIEFPPSIRDPPSLGPACSRRDKKPIRWLVRSGEMTQLVWKTDEMKLTFGKKFHKIPLHVFLFNDLLVITKKKSEDMFICVEHCSRSLLEVCSSEAAGAARHALLLTLLENHEGRTVEMVVSCPSETDASRWAEALCPPRSAPGEAVYAGWDCPQVCALYAYRPAQPDELPLTEGDVINVTRKTSEGWYYGERTRDGEAGWFPGAYTAEVASQHVRARNLRQRYRLLALSGTYLGQKRRQL